MSSLVIKPALMFLLYCILPHQINNINTCFLCKEVRQKDHFFDQSCGHFLCLFCLEKGSICPDECMYKEIIESEKEGATGIEKSSKFIQCPNPDCSG